MTPAHVADALRAAFIGANGALRDEDHQKAAEVTPLLVELARTLRVRAPTASQLVVDACAGKSTVGVLAASLLGESVRVVAIERDPVRSRLLEDGARALGVAARVSLVAADVADAAAWPARSAGERDAPRPAVAPRADRGAIDAVVASTEARAAAGNAPPEGVRTVVALHACGAASDAVIAGAIHVNARHILVVPCCYGTATTRASPFMAAPVARRVDQARIDHRRTLTLEAAGYHTEVVELFSPTVSPFNLLWRARRVGEAVRMERARRELEAL